MLIPIHAIREAAARIGPRLHRTPMLTSRTLGEASRCLRCSSSARDFQKTGSFKPRGALNIILSLPHEQRAKGLVTVSAGNHAGAVAWAAGQAGVPCTVVMPTDAPRSKMEAVRAYGATIVAH
jgi:threonine dehydratase